MGYELRATNSEMIQLIKRLVLWDLFIPIHVTDSSVPFWKTVFDQISKFLTRHGIYLINSSGERTNKVSGVEYHNLPYAVLVSKKSGNTRKFEYHGNMPESSFTPASIITLNKKTSNPDSASSSEPMLMLGEPISSIEYPIFNPPSLPYSSNVLWNCPLKPRII